MSVSLEYEHAWHSVFLTGVHINVPLYPENNTSNSTNAVRPGFTFGVYLGAQIPVRVADEHYIVPRLTADGYFGLLTGADSWGTEKMYGGRAHLGADYRCQLKNTTLAIGIHYALNILHVDKQLGKAPTVMPLGNNGKNYLLNGLGASIGIAF